MACAGFADRPAAIHTMTERERAFLRYALTRYLDGDEERAAAWLLVLEHGRHLPPADVLKLLSRI